MRRCWFLFLTIIPLFAGERVIRFAPLPMVKSETILKQNQPALDYLETRTGYKFKMVYYADYATLLEKIKNGEVDVAFLGPLPYVTLQQMGAHVQPIVRFLNKKGKDKYTCSLFTRKGSGLKTADLHGKRIALTQRLSTCGYLSMENLLRRVHSSLEQNRYKYMGTHSNSVLAVVMGDADAGGAKTSIVQGYRHLQLSILLETDPLPGFLWVAAAALPGSVVTAIRDAMLRLHPLTHAADAKITQSWWKGIRYGAVPARDRDYDIIRDMLQHVTIPQ